MVTCNINYKSSLHGSKERDRGDSFNTYARRGRRSSKSARHAYNGGEGVNSSKYVRKKVPFIILRCLWRQLSLLCYKALAMTILLSLKSFTAYFSMDLLIGCLKAFPLEMGVRWERVRTQWRGRSNRTCAYDGERGVKFLLLWCVRTN